MHKNAVERAFELAHTGDFQNTTQIKAQLRREGLDASQIFGKSIYRDLRRLCQALRKPELAD